MRMKNDAIYPKLQQKKAADGIYIIDGDIPKSQEI